MYENRPSVRPPLVLGLSTVLLLITYDFRVLHSFPLDGRSAVVVFNEDIGIYLICRGNISTPVVLNASLHDLQHNASRWTSKIMGGTAITIGVNSTAVSFTPVNDQIIILCRNQHTVYLLNQVQNFVKQPLSPFFMREDGEIFAMFLSNKDVAVDVLAEKKLVRLPLNSCSSYSTCNHCLVSRMDNCGWFILEIKRTIRLTCFRFNPTLTDQRIFWLNALLHIFIFREMKRHHPLPMITILVTAMLSLQPVLAMNSTPPTKINGIDCAEMEQAGPRSEHDEKQIRQMRNGILVPFHEERHAFPDGHNYEQILACQSGHTFYFCNADSIWLQQLNSTAIGFGDISINLDSRETSVENLQDTATAFPPWYWYPQAWLENVSLSADIYCCSSPVIPRDCSRGFKLVYGDKTEIPVTAVVSETSPPTDATTDAPIDMTTVPTSSPTLMTSLQTGGIPAQYFN
ncbi:hypothetical protein BV898_19849, partial [Hypsibius exemplaris]